MDKSTYLITIIGMGLVTYLPRWIPLDFLARRKMPQWLIEWLDLIPVAILSALLLPELITAGGTGTVTLMQPKLIAAIPTFAFGIKTKSLGGTVIVGMLLFWIVEKII